MAARSAAVAAPAAAPALPPDHPAAPGRVPRIERATIDRLGLRAARRRAGRSPSR